MAKSVLDQIPVFLKLWFSISVWFGTLLGAWDCLEWRPGMGNVSVALRRPASMLGELVRTWLILFQAQWLFLLFQTWREHTFYYTLYSLSRNDNSVNHLRESAHQDKIWSLGIGLFWGPTVGKTTMYVWREPRSFVSHRLWNAKAPAPRTALGGTKSSLLS